MDASNRVIFYEDVEEEDDGNDGERSEESAMESNRRSKVYKWSSSLLDFGFAFIGCDPFAIYGQDKVSEKAAPANTCNPPVTFGRPSSWRSRWAKISMFLGIYVAVKSVAAFVLRCVIVHLSTHSPDASKRIVGLLESLLMLIGDPFSSLSSLRMIVYLIGPLWCFASTSVLPYYAAHYQPLNCPFARFLLKPKLELQRFDAETGKSLDQMLETVEKRRLELTDIFWMAKSCQVNQANHLSQILKVKMQLEQLKLLKRKLHIRRPESMRPEWHKRTYESFLRFVLPSLAVNSLFGATMTFCYNWLAWQARCDELSLAQSETSRQVDSWMDCPLLEAFSLPDLLLGFEISIQVLVTTMNSYGFLLIMHFFQVRSQLYLTDDVNKQLQQVLNKLRIFNRVRKNAMDASETMAREQLDVSLAKAVLSLWMFERESQANVSFVGQIEVILIFIMMMVTFVCFTIINSSASWAQSLLSGSIPADPSSSSSVAFINWLMGLSYANVLLIHCAGIPSQATKLKRTVFSVMSELSRMQMSPSSLRHSEELERQHQPTLAYKIFLEDPLIAFLRRFVLTGMFADNQPSVRVFTVGLTYDQVLKINFIVATIISLVTLRS